ncbi:MAG: peptidase T [Lentisphaeria bacterium]|nr:peptidase T [Lentisphaeria bacterium]
MEKILKRFLEYIAFDTQSDAETHTHPSTEKQFRLAEYLRDELLSIGLKDVKLDDRCYVYARIPATAGYENVPVLGLIAHMDTSDAASGANVKPQIIRNWDGSPIPLGTSRIRITPQPHLKGGTIITTDGTTLLGGDDKAGIAIIVTAVEKLLNSTMPHGAVSIAFTPDEEIGEGTDFFDLELFGADYAYTVDGGAAEYLETGTFNAAGAEVICRGISTHPGSAKNLMINAQKIAMEFNSMLPVYEVPEHTAGLEGFYHLTHSSGNVSQAELHYILRDHSSEILEKRKKFMLETADFLNMKYGQGTVSVALKEQYRNMAEIIEKYPFLVDIASKAIRDAGLEPTILQVRGGTDGARLSFMGLPCPNLGYGGYEAHGEREYIHVESMIKVVDIIMNITSYFTSLPDRLHKD